MFLFWIHQFICAVFVIVGFYLIGKGLQMLAVENSRRL